MTVKDCKPGDSNCAQEVDPFLSQDSENLLGRVLAGMTFSYLICDYIILKCPLFFILLLRPRIYCLYILLLCYSLYQYSLRSEHLFTLVSYFEMYRGCEEKKS